MFYPLFRLMARLTLHLFFRRIEVEGRTNIATNLPYLLVPNHTNALVDPLLLVTTLRRRVTLTAKNVLAQNRFLSFLMKYMGVVAFHRRADVGQGADLRQNVRSFQQCREILRRGGALCIFPEGISHSDPGMRPFHTGAARIALDYLAQDSSASPLQVVPVGLLYTEKDRFRSAVWLRYGERLDVAAWRTGHPEGNAHDLTEEIRRRVESLTIHYRTSDEALILQWGAEIVETGGEAPLPLGWEERSVASWFGLLSRLQNGYRTLMADYRRELDDLAARVRSYRAELDSIGVQSAEVFLPMRTGKALFFLFRELELLLLGVPLAFFGALNHILPVLIVKRIARALSKDKDHWATNVVYPSFVVFPFFYVVQIGLAWLLLPSLWAGIYTVALPYSGLVAILYFERLRASLGRLRTFVYFLRHRSRQKSLASEGREIIALIGALEGQLT